MATVNSHPATHPQKPSAAMEEPVAESSWIMKIGFDGQFLVLTTKAGGEYKQFNPVLGPTLFEQWKQSPSKGRFWNEQIKQSGASIKTIDKNIGGALRLHPKKDGPLQPHKTHSRRHAHG